MKLLTSAFILMILISCSEEDTALPDPGQLYLDYKISGEEGNPDATIHLRFRVGGPDRRTVALPKNASVIFDGQTLPVDSTEYTGTYYETQRRLDSLTGIHTILFKDWNGKEYKEEFSFNKFSLQSELPDTIIRGDLEFIFTSADTDFPVLIVLTDTTFETRDINENRNVTNNRLTITAEELQFVSDGPIFMEILKEEDLGLKNPTGKGGKLIVSYGLKRQFHLVTRQ